MNKFKRAYLIIYPIALLNLSGCVSLERSHSSGYYSSAAELDVRRERRHSDREIAGTQLGFDARGDLDSEQNEAIELRILLGQAEKTLRGRREHEQYFANKPYMRSDRERLQFLALDSSEERSRWLATRGIFGAATPHSSQVQQLIDVNDIAIGMTKQAVRDSWGEPELVEIAGNPVYGNERWQYTEQVSSTEGFKGELRVVYFESGRVVGWETN